MCVLQSIQAAYEILHAERVTLFLLDDSKRVLMSSAAMLRSVVMLIAQWLMCIRS